MRTGLYRKKTETSFGEKKVKQGRRLRSLCNGSLKRWWRTGLDYFQRGDRNKESWGRKARDIVQKKWTSVVAQKGKKSQVTGIRGKKREK